MYIFCIMDIYCLTTKRYYLCGKGFRKMMNIDFQYYKHTIIILI